MMFDDFTPPELEKVEKIGTLKRYAAGDVLIAEGEPGRSFSLILKGRVQVDKRSADGHQRKLAELGPCDVVGELGFFGLPHRSATVVALDACEVLEFDHDRFEAFITAQPAIGLKVYRGMARVVVARFAQKDEAMVDELLKAIARTTAVAAAAPVPSRPKRLFKGPLP